MAEPLRLDLVREALEKARPVLDHFATDGEIAAERGIAGEARHAVDEALEYFPKLIDRVLELGEAEAELEATEKGLQEVVRDALALTGPLRWLRSVLEYARERDRRRTTLLKLAMVWVERCAAATRDRHFGSVYYDVNPVSAEERQAARCTLTRIDEELRSDD